MVVVVPFTVRVKEVEELILPVVGSVTVVSPALLKVVVEDPTLSTTNGVGSRQCASSGCCADERTESERLRRQTSWARLLMFWMAPCRETNVAFQTGEAVAGWSGR